MLGLLGRGTDQGEIAWESMDRPRNEAFVEASDALSSEDALQRAQCTSNHTGLLLTDNHDSCNLKWMGEQDRAKGKSCIHR